MVKSSADDLDACFAALAHPIRRGIVERLVQGDATVGELAGPWRVSAPAISKHLAVLEDAGLVERERAGRTIRVRARAHPLREAQRWLDRHARFWEGTLDALEAHLADEAEDDDT